MVGQPCRVALDDVAKHVIDQGHDVFVQPRLGRFGVSRLSAQAEKRRLRPT
jgi:hypothetical protein